ncbi:hypothetical protein GCM10010269_57540 [Streptomyces humidus]|uniref:Uncharacterized protein n=1 Tax=Streptomyces humidus TaxID=52259 RepID=A0A918G0T6_9ACTN|nr:hypothetical protein GCM10010269_57540 [Streptomyces humidus]
MSRGASLAPPSFERTCVRPPPGDVGLPGASGIPLTGEEQVRVRDTFPFECPPHRGIREAWRSRVPRGGAGPGPNPRAEECGGQGPDLLDFGDHESTVSTILPCRWPSAARLCALPASSSG